MLYLSLLFFALAAFFNAVMDKTETRIAFNTSVFRDLKGTFWCKERSADIRPFLPGTKYRPDAWHIAKSLMVILMAAAVISYRPVKWSETSQLLNWLVDMCLYGTAWNGTFNLFYNRILKAK